MNNWFSVEVEVQRRRDEAAAKAEQYQRLQAFLVHNVLPRRRYQRLRVYLGAQLEAWGCRLQARYSAIALPADGPYLPPEQIANHHRTEPC